MNTIPRTSGIYQIRCVPTGKVYIGSAINLERRKRQHWAELARNDHHNPHLQNAWNRYGAEAFTFTVLALVLPACLTEIEQQHIDQTRCFDPAYGFNIAPIAGSHLGIKRSATTRLKLSLVHRGKKRGPMPADRRHNIATAKRGKRYTPHTDVARWQKSIRMIGRKLTETTKAKIAARRKGQIPSAATRIAQFEATAKEWLITNPNGELFRIKGLDTFCREHGLTASAMRNVAKGKQTHHRGWRCRKLSP